VIVYDDLKTPHLVATEPEDMLDPDYSSWQMISPPGSVLGDSPSSVRSAGDGGSGHYATVGPSRLRGEALYSSLRRPDGQSDYEGEEQHYACLEPTEGAISSEASSQATSSQATIIQATDLYARVDWNKKKKRNSDSSSSPTTDTPVPVPDPTPVTPVSAPCTESPVPAPRRMVVGGRGRQENAEGS